MNMNTQISNDKRSLKRSISNVNKLLANDPVFKARFNEIIKTHKKRGHVMGASDDDSPWYKSAFATDLFDMSKDLLKSRTVSRDQQKILNMELETIEAKNRSLDKQIALRKSTTGVTAFAGSYFDELMNSPLKLAAVAGLGFLLFKRLKARK